MGPYQRTPKEVARAIRYSGLGVRSVGPVGDFLEICVIATKPWRQCLAALPNQQTSPKPSTLTKWPGLFSEITAFFLIQTAVVLHRQVGTGFKELMFE